VGDLEDAATLKASLRRLMRDVRRAVPGDERQRQGVTVADRLVTVLSHTPADAIVLSYRSIAEELPTDVINARLAERWRVAVPRVTANGVEAVVGASQWEPRAFGILEPVDGDVVEADALSAVIVPGVAFTVHGDRLGQGGGYYDRLLPAVRGISIGVCLTQQIVEHLPMMSHDQRVQVITTADDTFWPARPSRRS
jgi:5-formyltetrahydrofolate cyclo-ligase